jgi:deoxyribonuclease V
VWGWPADESELIARQHELAAAADAVESWPLPDELDGLLVAAVFVTFPTGSHGPGRAGEPAWAGAVLRRGARVVESAVVPGESGAPYAAGLLALREGPLLEGALRALQQRPDLVLVDATGRDHPRRAGLALHLGAVLDLPTIGVTNRPLVAAAAAPGPCRGEVAPLTLDDVIVGYAVRTRSGANPLLAHAAWRTAPETAREVLLAVTARWRTPRPLRDARTLARVARAADEGRLPPGPSGPTSRACGPRRPP